MCRMHEYCSHLHNFWVLNDMECVKVTSFCNHPITCNIFDVCSYSNLRKLNVQWCFHSMVNIVCAFTKVWDILNQTSIDSIQEVMEECSELSWGQFKPLLADALIAHLQPIQVQDELICSFCFRCIVHRKLLIDNKCSFNWSDQPYHGCVHFVQKRYSEIIEDPSYIDSILADGRAKANEIAQFTLSNAFQAMGFLSRQKI
jgi:hypothetical protein